MPIFKYYDETGKLITEHRETLNKTNLPRFVENMGDERAAIYLAAIRDVYMELDDVINFYLDDKTRSYGRSAHLTRRLLLEYLGEKKALLQSEQVEHLMGPLSDEQSLPSKPSAQ